MGFLTKNSGKIAELSRFLSDGVKAPDRQRIFRGTFHSFLIQGISILLVFVSNIWLVRSSDPESYGLYVHVFNWMSILSVFVLAGHDDLVLALIPRFASEGKPLLIARLVKVTNRWLIVATLVVNGLFLGVISLIPIKALSEHRPLFLLSITAVYFTAFLGLNQLILQALNHIRLSQIVEKIGKPLLLIAFTGVFHLTAVSFNGNGLILLSSIVLGICSVVVLVVVGRKLKRLTADAAQASFDLQPRGYSRQAFYFFCISLLNLLSTRITMLIMPYFTMTTKDIGIFNISNRFADLLIFPFFLMHTVLPQLFARHSVTEREYMQALFNTGNKLMSLLCLPLLLVNILAGKFLLHWFGPDFVSGYAALVYISLAQFLFSLFGPSNTILMMQGWEKYSALCLLVYILILVAACCILLPIAGITGGALAILIGSLFYNLLLAVVNYRTTGICSPFFSFLIRRR
jgi:O-antigen/teichoic acid export membrane protein